MRVPLALPEDLDLTLGVWSLLGWKRVVVEGWRVL